VDYCYRLERQYTKNEIIAMYFNKADFVNTAVGIRSAAKVYFGKEPRDLSIEEGAMLVGMLKNPSLYQSGSSNRESQKSKKCRVRSNGKKRISRRIFKKL
jgi:penicillin-binding protein 1A